MILRPSDHEPTILLVEVDDEHDTAERIRDTLRSEGLRTTATSAIPVLVLTARGEEADARRGLPQGAKRYRSKPFDLRALIAEVRRHLGTQAPESRRASL